MSVLLRTEKLCRAFGSLVVTKDVDLEIRAGERWIAVDPTWNQPVADATHVKLAAGDLVVYPGSSVLARRDNRGRVLGHLENWSRLPLFQGAYSNNQPGYFTSIEGLYARPAGNVYFAGEHTDSFYSYQGFMEGALLSGARAADEVLRGV